MHSINLYYSCPKQKPTKPSYFSMVGLQTVLILHFNFCCCKHWLGAAWMAQRDESGRWPLEVTCRAGFISFNVTRNQEATVIQIAVYFLLFRHSHKFQEFKKGFEICSKQTQDFLLGKSPPLHYSGGSQKGRQQPHSELWNQKELNHKIPAPLRARKVPKILVSLKP